MGIHINRVYTRAGDGGETQLVGGRRVPKHCLRVECYGTIDELNATLGLARSFIDPDVETEAELEPILRRLQNELFDLGSELATPPEALHPEARRTSDESVAGLEELIDRFNATLTPLKSFVLPGGGRVPGFLHLARTVCRRAERLIVALRESEPVREQALQYVNRLSDLLFVLGRLAASATGRTEYLWEGGLQAGR